MSIIILDTETTGLTPPIGVVQVAALELDANLNIVDEYETLVNPGQPIEPGAMAIHGKTEEMVVGAPTLQEALGHFPTEVTMVCHNVAFDRRVVSPVYVPRDTLCTLELARTLLPKAPNHKLTTLIDYLGLQRHQAHDALGDVRMTHQVLQVLVHIAGVPFETLVKRATEPKMLHIMPFGKHKGLPMMQIPRDYRHWLLQQPDLSPDLRYTLTKLDQL